MPLSGELIFFFPDHFLSSGVWVAFPLPTARLGRSTPVFNDSINGKRGERGEKALEQTPGAWADSRAGKQRCHFPPTIYYFLAFHFLSLFECSFKRKKRSIYC